MEALRQWVLLLCSGCILYGLLENLLPRRGVYPVIKIVIVLYILLLLLSPADSILDFEPESAGLQIPSVSGETQQTTGQFLRQAALSLQKTVTDALSAAGYDAQLLGLELENEGRVITSVHLHLRGAAQEEQEGIRALCDSLLGVPAAYTWENE